MPGVIGVAEVSSIASSTTRSTPFRMRFSSTNSQPPVPPGSSRDRVAVTSPRLAVTENVGIVEKTFCSMYEPSDEAKYRQSLEKLTDAVALTTSFCLIAASTTACRSAFLSVSDILVGSLSIGVSQFT